MMAELKLCRNCREGFLPRKRSHDFCSNKCRAEHHRNHMPTGVVRSVRKISNGKISVTIYLDDPVALDFHVHQKVTIGGEG